MRQLNWISKLMIHFASWEKKTKKKPAIKRSPKTFLESVFKYASIIFVETFFEGIFFFTRMLSSER